MPMLELSFASGEDSLSVRRFTVREGISTLFEVSVWAHSPNEDIDLEAIVGKPASLRIESGVKHALHGRRVWSGVCSYIEQLQAETTGLSTYHIRIVPTLWPLTHRSDHRIFQHQSVPAIVRKVLEEWNVEPIWRIDAKSYPKLEYRVQYGESDFDFVCRMLEEAGIAFVLSDENGDASSLIFSDHFHAGEAREGGPIQYIDNPNEAAEREFVTRVKIAHEVRAGKVTIRDFDFRRKPDYKLVGQAAAGSEERYEHHHYLPGSFLVEGHKGGETPVADDRGVARADEKTGKARAEQYLASERASKRKVGFETNVLDLRPGQVFSISHHARPDLAPDKRLLVTEASIEGTHDGEWKITGQAVFGVHAFYPPRKAMKPRVYGVQSAVVVGPEGEEIHTDEFGRVRVQFHWDREGGFDERSSCWVRVSQGWAGGGFGMITIPRIGQEVLVGFLEGDPDQPIVVGRVFNNTARVPYKLPDYKTRSTWKSDSSPGSEGFNEIMFEDAKGKEFVYVQAERNLDKLVKVNETITVGRNRATTVGEMDEAAIGVKEASHIRGTPTGREMVAGRISLTTGEATITLDGPNITLDAGASVTLNAGTDVAINGSSNVSVNGSVNVIVNGGANVTVGSNGPITIQAAGGDLVLQGGPMVKVNPGAASGDKIGDRAVVPGFNDFPVVIPPDVDIDANIRLAEANAAYDPERPAWFYDMVKPSGEWDFTRVGKQYYAFSMFHVGLIGSIIGYPLPILLRLAGQCRVERSDIPAGEGDPGNGLWGGAYPFATDKPTCDAIVEGYRATETSISESSTEQRRDSLVARRLGDLRNWQIYELARDEEEDDDVLCTLCIRSDNETRKYEYGIWLPHSADVEATGSIDYGAQRGIDTKILDSILLDIRKRHLSK